ncbi:hypothetical protein [uncultured Psychrosphaera sp.]|uniref:hypothetical protein n=1 Tax=uncultured Psychrosphaera sp. TaxID=1403522 RepID=UPI00263314F3|nr:hypothetical protein [uncultured Psychrosphaera sp.]
MELLKPTSVNSTADYKAGDKTSLTRDDLTSASGSLENVTKVKELDSSHVALSKPNVEQLLADQLLLDAGNYGSLSITQYEAPPIAEKEDSFYIQQQFIKNVNGNLDRISDGKDTAELFNTVQHALTHSESAHKNIADIFSSLGQLDKDTESYLIASQNYIENNLQSNFPTLDKENEFAKGSSFIDFPDRRASRVSYEVETLEGDIVTVTYRTSSSLDGDSGFNGLLYQVDGELSEEEHEALNKLFMGTAEYVGQVAGGNRKEAGLDSINIAENFDMSLLKGFSIDTNIFANETHYEYEVNQETKEQTLSIDMNIGLQNFDFDLTTSLLGSKDEEELTRYALEMKDLLEEFGFQKGHHELLNDFIVDSFTSLFDVNTQKSQHDIDKFVIPTIGKRVGANQFTSKISSLMDYKFSLNLDENKNFADEVVTRIKMSQVSESQKHGKMYEFTQQKNFSLYSSVSTLSNMEGVNKDVVITRRKEELENKVTLDGIQNTLNFASKHNLDNRVEDSRYFTDGSSVTNVTEESIVELSELKLVEDILSNMYTSTRETKKETIEKEEADGAARVTAKSKAIDVYMQYDALKLS